MAFCKQVMIMTLNYSLKTNFLIVYINGRYIWSNGKWRPLIKTKKVYGLEKYRKPNSDFYFETESYQDQANSTREDGTRAPLIYPVSNPSNRNKNHFLIFIIKVVLMVLNQIEGNI